MERQGMKSILLSAFVLCIVSGLVRADDSDDPTRGVARISVLQGDVQVRRGDTGEVSAAAMNAPLMSQDAIRTGPDSRVEIQLDYAHFVRVAPSSEVHFADVEQGRFQVQVASGTVTLTVMADSQVQAEVDTPNAGLHPNTQGAYRITVGEDGTSQITVRAGEAEIFTPKGSETLNERQTMIVRGPASDPEFRVIAEIPLDAWDNWNQDQDQRIEHAQSAERQYVNPQVYGTESMDGYGTWQENPDYGPVWVPTVAPGWAPYRYGRWVWEDWYGWTWVSYDPWGWAPYHWGSWFWWNGGWCWHPGAYRAWSPARVAFFGFGPRVGFGFGFGNIGWVPLGPHEAFYPWWGRGFYGHPGGMTVVNNINVVGAYRNARVMNGVTAVGAGEFGRRDVRGSSMRVTGGDLRGAGVVHGQVPIAPARESLKLSDRAAVGGFSPTRGQFFSHMQTAHVDRVSFVQQQRGMQQTIQRNFTRPAATAYGRPGLGAQTAAGANAEGWRRESEAPAQSLRPAAPASRPAASSPGDNWHRFDTPAPRYGSSGSTGQAVHIAPRIVYERPPSGNGGGYGPAYRPAAPPPSYRGGGSTPAHAGSSAPRSSGGGGAHSSAGGGGHAGGGHR